MPNTAPRTVADSPNSRYFAKISRLKNPSALVVPTSVRCSSIILLIVA